MKRMLAILLTLTMLLSLAACGGKDEPSIKDNIPATKAPTEAPTEPPQPGQSVQRWRLRVYLSGKLYHG